jgi:hypothetical protein
VAIKDRADIGGNDPAGRRMAYVVSLQFLIPGTISLLSQVALDKATDLALVAAVPPLGKALSGYLTPLQVEAILLCLLVFLGVQAAWVVAMAPKAVAQTD